MFSLVFTLILSNWGCFQHTAVSLATTFFKESKQWRVLSMVTSNEKHASFWWIWPRGAPWTQASIYNILLVCISQWPVFIWSKADDMLVPISDEFLSIIYYYYCYYYYYYYYYYCCCCFGCCCYCCCCCCCCCCYYYYYYYYVYFQFRKSFYNGDKKIADIVYAIIGLTIVQSLYNLTVLWNDPFLTLSYNI